MKKEYETLEIEIKKLYTPDVMDMDLSNIEDGGFAEEGEGNEN